MTDCDHVWTPVVDHGVYGERSLVITLARWASVNDVCFGVDVYVSSRTSRIMHENATANGLTGWSASVSLCVPHPKNNQDGQDRGL